MGGTGGWRRTSQLPFSDLYPERIEAMRRVLAQRGFDPPARFWVQVGGRYGSLDLEQEAQKMLGWLTKNPGRELNERFVRNWLGRARHGRR